MRKFDHLQILRAVAASLVVIDHGFVEFNPSGVRDSHYNLIPFLTGYAGVASFFILSGLIMTLQAGDQFGQRSSPYVFAWRRLIRIVPMYWLATAITFRRMVVYHSPMPHRIREFLLSMAFLPDIFNADHARMFPVVLQGWTLNYEMAFYVMFSLALFLPRRIGIPALILLPELLVALGQTVHMPAAPSPMSILGYYMDPTILLFSRGVLIGWVLRERRQMPTLRMPFSPALLLFVPTLLMCAFPSSLGAAPLWESFITYCTVVILLCIFTAQDNPGRFSRFLVLLGDASYSTYLFHLFWFPWILPRMQGLLPRMHLGQQLPVLFIVVSVVVANAMGLLIHLVVELPITKLLRRIKFGLPRVSRPSPAVGA